MSARHLMVFKEEYLCAPTINSFARKCAEDGKKID
jgi:hypothetical protein